MAGQKSHDLILNQLSVLQKEVQQIRLASSENEISFKDKHGMKIKRLGSRPSKIERLGATERVVEMYNQGFTLREIAEAISSKEIQVSHMAVHNFIQKVRKLS